MTDLKMEVCREVHESMVGETHEVLVVEEGTGDSVKCRDEAYRQVIVTNGAEKGVAVGDYLEVEITASEAVYCFGEPV
jgi:tRNA A37 methylthiotransferase MiaB